MRKALFLIGLALFAISGLLIGESSALPVEDNIVIIKYNNDIDGMRVEAIWVPNVLRNGYVIGAAIIRFTNIQYGTSSTVVNNNFGVLENRVSEFIKWGKDEKGESQIQSLLGKTIHLDYTNPKIAADRYKFGTTEEPFFFYDIDFDGKEELLVVETFIGQRFRSTFKVFKLSDDQDISLLEDDFLQITYEEPYISLDEGATVDASNKTIEINLSGGAADSMSNVYKINPAHSIGNNPYVFEKSIGYSQKE